MVQVYEEPFGVQDANRNDAINKVQGDAE